jgi:hypothetical protein
MEIGLSLVSTVHTSLHACNESVTRAVHFPDQPTALLEGIETTIPTDFVIVSVDDVTCVEGYRSTGGWYKEKMTSLL